MKQFVAGGSHLSPDGIELLVYHSGRWVFLSFLVSVQEISVEEMHGGGGCALRETSESLRVQFIYCSHFKLLI